MSVDQKVSKVDFIDSIFYLWPDEVSSEIRLSEVKVQVYIIAGKAWKPIYFTPGTAKLTTTEMVEFTGRAFDSKFEVLIPGDLLPNRADLNLLCGRPIVLSLGYHSGKFLICGGKNRKLRLVNQGTFGGANGNQVTFEYKSKTNFMYAD